MDIDRVRYFCIFASTGSLVKASAILKISQPALSKSLRLLEHELGFKLALAEGRGLKLTEQGQLFWKAADPLLQNWMALPKNLKSKNITTLPLRIGTFEVFSTYFLRRILDISKLPTLDLQELAPGKLEDAIMQKKIDVGITYMPIAKPQIKFTEITQIKMGVFGLNSLKPFVIPLDKLEGTPSKVMGLDGWPDHKFQREIAFRVTLMESALELCRQGKAIAYLPEFIVKLHNEIVKKEYELKELPCPIPAKERVQSVYLIQHKNGIETQDIRHLAKALRSVR